jgi:hypothetical protein
VKKKENKSEKNENENNESQKRGKSNLAEVDTSELLKALRATHEEPPVSQLAADAANYAAAFEELNEISLGNGLEIKSYENSASEVQVAIQSEDQTENVWSEQDEKIVVSENGENGESGNGSDGSHETVELVTTQHLPAESISDEPVATEPVPTEPAAFVDELAQELADAEAKSVIESLPQLNPFHFLALKIYLREQISTEIKFLSSSQVCKQIMLAAIAA